MSRVGLVENHLYPKSDRDLSVLECFFFSRENGSCLGRQALATVDGRAYDRLELTLKLLDELLVAEMESRANAGVVARGSSETRVKLEADSKLCDPLEERVVLKRWKRLVAWLKSVDCDASAALGARCAAALGDARLSFHELLRDALAVLEPLLSEESAPRLQLAARLAGLAPGALWVALARRGSASFDKATCDDAAVWPAASTRALCERVRIPRKARV